jgi:hypothetical protein
LENILTPAPKAEELPPTKFAHDNEAPGLPDAEWSDSVKNPDSCLMVYLPVLLTLILWLITGEPEFIVVHAV